MISQNTNHLNFHLNSEKEVKPKYYKNYNQISKKYIIWKPRKQIAGFVKRLIMAYV